MHISQKQALAQISHDLAQVLQEDSYQLCGLVSYFDGETPPELIDLISHQNEVDKNVLSEQEADALQAAERPQYKKRDTSKLNANFRCELCHSRLYPVNQYLRTGKLPVLILYYNMALQSRSLQRDRSAVHIFGGPKEDNLWNRILSKLGFTMNDFYYQEYLACHFNASRSTESDWQERAAHCKQHLIDTITKYKLSKVVLSGNAALLLLTKEQADKYAKTAKVFDFIIGKEKLQAVVLRSPSALLAIENRRESQGMQNTEKYQQLVAEEKDIKNNILTALQTLLKS